MGKEEYDDELQPQNEKVVDVPCDDDKDDLESQFTGEEKNKSTSENKQGFR